MKKYPLKNLTEHQKRGRWVCYLIAGIVGYLILAKLITIFRYHYIMDEFVDLSIAADLYRGLLPYRDIIFPRPFLFNYILSLPLYLVHDPLWILWISRFWIFFLNLGILFLTYKITHYYARETTSALFSVLLVGTAIPFLFNGCRLRCDLVNSFLYLVVYYMLLTHWEQPGWGGLLEGGVLGCAFLISQKAAYYILLYFASLIILLWLEEEKKVWWRRLGASLFGLCAPLGLFMLWAWTKGLLPLFYQQNIQRAFHVGVNSNVYNTFQYLIRFTRQNIFSAGLLIVSFLLFFRKGKESFQSKPGLMLGLNAICLFGVMFFHKARFPYFFIISIPMLAIFTATQMQPLINQHSLLSLGLVGLVAAAPLFLSVRLWKNSAGYQYELIRAGEAFLQPGDSYFDGIGMIFTRKKAAQLDMTVRNIREYYHGIYSRLIPQWIQNQCKLIIQNYRIEKLRDPEKHFISNNYLPTPQNPHILIPGKILNPNQREFEIFIEGTYRLLNDGNQKVTIDRQRAKASFYLSKGKHSYTLEPHRNPVILIDASVDRYQKEFIHWRKSIYPGYSW